MKKNHKRGPRNGGTPQGGFELSISIVKEIVETVKEIVETAAVSKPAEKQVKPESLTPVIEKEIVETVTVSKPAEEQVEPESLSLNIEKEVLPNLKITSVETPELLPAGKKKR